MTLQTCASCVFCSLILALSADAVCVCVCESDSGFYGHRVLCLSFSTSPFGPSVAVAAGAFGSPGRRPGPDQVQISAAVQIKAVGRQPRAPGLGYPQICCTSINLELLGFSARLQCSEFSRVAMRSLSGLRILYSVKFGSSI